MKLDIYRTYERFLKREARLVKINRTKCIFWDGFSSRSLYTKGPDKFLRKYGIFNKNITI